jgi:hypothetical protein
VFLADAKPDSRSSTFRARSLPVPTHGPGRGTLMAVSTSRRTPFLAPAIFGLKDNVNRRCFHMHRSPRCPGQQSLPKPGAPFPPPLLPRVSRTLSRNRLSAENVFQIDVIRVTNDLWNDGLNPTRASPCDHIASAVGHVFPAVPLTSISYEGLSLMVAVNPAF